MVEPGLKSSFIQIYTFRGRVIWHGNTFEDVGTFQTYGKSTEVILNLKIF